MSRTCALCEKPIGPVLYPLDLPSGRYYLCGDCFGNHYREEVRRDRDRKSQWVDGDDAFVSVAFTWDVDKAWQRAAWLRHAGYRVRVGGPGVYVKTPAREAIRELGIEVGGNIPDAVVHHNPMATFASRGCPVGCWFCIVPAMEGRDFTLLPDFPVRPILCDNNLSALPADFQDYIVGRYQATGVPLLDANSGFEPRTFDEEVFERWRPVNRGPWRFALDDQGDLPHVLRVLEMLRGRVRRAASKRVYVLIGNEPLEPCLDRIMLVLDRGAEPHVQPLMKLNATERKPWVQHDWTSESLRAMARWANRRLWRYVDFQTYAKERSVCLCA